MSRGLIGAISSAPSSLAISTVYTGSGAINPADTLALVNGSSACAMTLASGTDGHCIRIKRYGVGSVSVTTNIDGSAGAVLNANSSGGKEMLDLVWAASLNTWLTSV